MQDKHGHHFPEWLMLNVLEPCGCFLGARLRKAKSTTMTCFCQYLPVEQTLQAWKFFSYACPSCFATFLASYTHSQTHTQIIGFVTTPPFDPISHGDVPKRLLPPLTGWFTTACISYRSTHHESIRSPSGVCRPTANLHIRSRKRM